MKHQFLMFHIKSKWEKKTFLTTCGKSSQEIGSFIIYMIEIFTDGTVATVTALR